MCALCKFLDVRIRAYQSCQKSFVYLKPPETVAVCVVLAGSFFFYVLRSNCLEPSSGEAFLNDYPIPTILAVAIAPQQLPSYKIVMFDADGVLQCRPKDWDARLFEFVGRCIDVDAFLTDVFQIELPALEGKHMFADALPEVLSRWNCQRPPHEFLTLWSLIETESEVRDIIRNLRSIGLRCYLASNQEENRARHMSGVLGYRSLFDGEFYSCRMGASKPHAAFFRAILSQIAVLPDQILFIDDREENVLAARQEGLCAARFKLDSGVAALREIIASHGINLRALSKTDGMSHL